MHPLPISLSLSGDVIFSFSLILFSYAFVMFACCKRELMMYYEKNWDNFCRKTEKKLKFLLNERKWKCSVTKCEWSRIQCSFATDPWWLAISSFIEQKHNVIIWFCQKYRSSMEELKFILIFSQFEEKKEKQLIR